MKELVLDEKAFLRIVKQSSAAEVVSIVHSMEEAARRACAPGAVRLYRQVERFSDGGRARDPGMLDLDAAVVAVLGTATLADILALKRMPIPLWGSISDLYGALALPWLQEAVDQLMVPEDVLALEPLWRDGICALPSCDAVVLGCFDNRLSGKLDESVLLGSLVWRFFEVAGQGALSLPAHDRAALRRRELGFSDRGAPWAERLLGCARDGALSRDQMLSASLTAAGRMERPVDIRWFGALHEALEPSGAEVTARQSDYKALATDGQAARSAFGKRMLRRQEG